MYVDHRGGIYALYRDTDTSWTVHYVNEAGEDAFGTLSAVSPMHVFFRPDAETLIKGVWSGTCISWTDDEAQWIPMKMSRLQYKYMTQVPYVPMSIAIVYACVCVYTVVVDCVKKLFQKSK